MTRSLTRSLAAMLPPRTPDNTIEALAVAPEDVPAGVAEAQYPEYIPVWIHDGTWQDDGADIVLEADIEWIVEEHYIPLRPGPKPRLMAPTWGSIRCSGSEFAKVREAGTDVRYVRADRVAWSRSGWFF